MPGAGGSHRAQRPLRVTVVVGEAEVVHAFEARGGRGAGNALGTGDAGDEKRTAGRRSPHDFCPNGRGEHRALETVSTKGRLEILRRSVAGFKAGEHRGVGQADLFQGLPQAAARQQQAAGKGVHGREGQELDVAAHTDVGEAVVEDEDIDGRIAAERESGCRAAVRADDDGDAGRLLGDHHRLVARLLDRCRRSVALTGD